MELAEWLRVAFTLFVLHPLVRTALPSRGIKISTKHYQSLGLASLISYFSLSLYPDLLSFQLSDLGEELYVIRDVFATFSKSLERKRFLSLFVTLIAISRQTAFLSEKGPDKSVKGDQIQLYEKFFTEKFRKLLLKVNKFE